ncbi:hypothetical protein [Massilia sp. BJB1822]|uniref:hypothetical protein n=1 Tax=Massilia sp. BJB1822 TaxID=2744470 RepID=UPI001592B422|nr:hypothetical protein [Massilia sp. BJB1822]NVE01677.1 hypothetical protein [Massilia sp. BJB1822]
MSKSIFLYKAKYFVFFIIAFVASCGFSWALSSYRLLYAIVLFGLYFFGGMGFFSFKTLGQKSFSFGVFFGILTGLLLYARGVTI